MKWIEDKTNFIILLIRELAASHFNVCQMPKLSGSAFSWQIL